jgi:lipid-binding SYLF domain-containing protein
LGAAAFAALSVAAPAYADHDDAEKMAALVKESQATLERCHAMSDACASVTNVSSGVLVFPEVTSASVGIGGAGGRGVLFVNGKVEGYYGIGEVSIGPQFEVKKSSQVYALNSEALNALRDDGSWKIGTDADVTVVGAGATDQTASGEGGTAAFVFDEKGLSAGVSLEGVSINRLEKDDF